MNRCQHLSQSAHLLITFSTGHYRDAHIEVRDRIGQAIRRASVERHPYRLQTHPRFGIDGVQLCGADIGVGNGEGEGFKILEPGKSEPQLDMADGGLANAVFQV